MIIRETLTQRAFLAAAIALNDLMHIVDVSDTSQTPNGSSYKMTTQQLAGFMKKAGMGNWTTLSPTVNDDSTQGYVNGAFWFDENAQKFYILNDNSAGAADWRPFDLQLAYDGGNVVNQATVIIDGGPHNFAIGFLAGTSVNSISNTNALGDLAMNNATANHANALGSNAGKDSNTNHANYFGQNAGLNNTTAFGVTVFSPQSVPSYADHAAAAAALTVANGCVAGQVYIYRNEANDTIGFVIPA